MTTVLTVPAAPPLATVPNVEIMHTGQWDISTGRVTVTTDDLAAAVAALDCPAVRKPVLKLGHSEPNPDNQIRWDGEPAVGWVANLAVAEDGALLVGDYVGMPGWLGEVIASAYPDRSAEWMSDYRCQLGHTHPVVVTAVALLGVMPPGIGVLQSLQDVATLYGVEAAAVGDRPGTHSITLPAKEAAVPNTRPAMVAASVSVEDVRRKYYAQNPSWDIYIEEFQLDPPQLIVCNDADGSRSRVPVTIGSGDGEAAVEFGPATKVVVRYEDAPANAAATGDGRVIRYASKAESRPQPSRAQQSAGDPTPEEGAGMDPAKLRDALGLAADASDQEVDSALAEAGRGQAAQPPAPPTPPAAPGSDGGAAPPQVPAAAAGRVVMVDAKVWEQMNAQVGKVDQLIAERQREKCNAAITAAVTAGKFPQAEREHYEALWNSDPVNTEKLLNALTPGRVPMATTGYVGADSADEAAEDAMFDQVFPPHMRLGGKR